MRDLLDGIAEPVSHRPPGRVQLWSCGGGRQSAGIAALILQGKLPKPDAVCMAALEWEKRSTFDYVNVYIRPAMQRLGIPFTYVSRKKYATKGLWGGADGDSLLIPAYTKRGDAAGWGRNALVNVLEIDGADVLALVASPEHVAGTARVPGGKFVEAGYALRASKRIVTVGGVENGMLYHPHVEHVADAAGLVALLAG